MEVLKNFIGLIGGWPNLVYNFFVLKMKGVEYSELPTIRGRIRIYGPGKIVIGKNVVINSSIKSNPIGGDGQTVLVSAKDAILTIGNNVGISNSIVFCNSKITIGDNVKIGGSVKIYDTDFHSLDYLKRRNQNTDVRSLAPVKIGCDCFIGAHSIILKGVDIGDTSIVGAGSVITKSIPKGEIWAGNPARCIRKFD